MLRRRKVSSEANEPEGQNSKKGAKSEMSKAEGYIVRLCLSYPSNDHPRSFINYDS